MPRQRASLVVQHYTHREATKAGYSSFGGWLFNPQNDEPVCCPSPVLLSCFPEEVAFLRERGREAVLEVSKTPGLKGWVTSPAHWGVSDEVVALLKEANIKQQPGFERGPRISWRLRIAR